jgi:mono/diheme cytochrome c family protein
MMRRKALVAGLCLGLAPGFACAAEGPSVERGRYLVQIAGCNDCHTAGYGPLEGNVPESEWLKGDMVGWRGPWGTTYAINLRIRLKEMSEDEWVAFAKTFKTRPPMPWFNVRAMDEADIRSIHMYVTSFDDVGSPVPEYVPPGREPEGPTITFPAPPK